MAPWSVVSRTDFFYLPPEAWGPPWRLDAEQSRHLAKVLRLGPGAVVRCLDGRGRVGDFEVVSTKGAVELALLEGREEQAPKTKTWLALGWMKSARRGWLLEKAVELGCSGIVFWEAARSQGPLPVQPKPAWLAQLVAGAKQCGNPWLPELECVPGGLSGLLARFEAFDRRFLLWESPEARTPLDPAALAEPGAQVFVIGPEGGIDNAEAEALLKSDCAPATLGPRPLRWETAALACLSLAACGPAAAG